MLHHNKNNARNAFDNVIQDITNYVFDFHDYSTLAINTAHYDLLDSLACGLMALQFQACTKLLGPVVPNAFLKNGARVFGTPFELDPVQAAFNIGTLIRWLDFNDTFLAAEWGHPSDNLGGILAITDYLHRTHQKKFTIKDILCAMIKAHEIQGVLALDNSFNQVGLDHVLLVKVATTAVVTHLLGGSKDQINNAISNAWLDGQSLRAYRHAPNTGSRKSWAAGDATSRGVRLALIAMQNEMGYPNALTTKTWGFYDVSFKGQSFSLTRPYANYVMENILFKISYPAEFHAQTAVECALQLHPLVKNKLEQIEKIDVQTQAPAMRIISKKGVLHNPADRDHCLEYMIAVPLIYGALTAAHYEDTIAKNPMIDHLRNRMQVVENKQFSLDYLDPEKRAIGNAIQITFKDGTKTDLISIDYPIGHKRRRATGIPLLIDKFKKTIVAHYTEKQAAKIIDLFLDPEKLMHMTIDKWMKLLCHQHS
ncbi:MAG: 2-methylcitrate dehydratase [Gammaproteobacteria bacterium CG_4_10_14_0_8_um_filter_38_16]|nr:MAG: 2-methylcitrate dehydratase [Gammaproteobacteria bacterium CG_4_10_14_0_8_um_filter_38_16]PJA03463.1 MAG: 2-methylcitrate dehydratase [Gammaproteobacteria bacterium CG_4_10_14_0_2_um_filter_38_22]PJB10618.1 MAG: 2-methylcitrate dehydratase [Gammaproteobacteria bacterium CG_4_9_14_3_um_filter_38_9]